MTSQNSVPANQLRNVLLPWRLAASVLPTKEDQGRSTRSVVRLMLLTTLIVVFAIMFGLMDTDVLWTFSVGAAGYCAALLALSFGIFNVTSMRR